MLLNALNLINPLSNRLHKDLIGVYITNEL